MFELIQGVEIQQEESKRVERPFIREDFLTSTSEDGKVLAKI